MKITIEIPDRRFRRAKTLAAAKGHDLEAISCQAIEDKLSHGAEASKAGEPAWMKLYGAFVKTKAMRADTRCIQKLIDREFERIDPENWM